MALEKRPYVPRENHGGNFCGHQPDAPRLVLVQNTTNKRRPQILKVLQFRIRNYYQTPTCLPSLRAANRSRKGRQQRSERREACLLLLAAILEFTDLASLRCGVPTAQGFLSLTLDYLVKFTGLHPRRAERAIADLKRANLLTVSQPRQLQEDGTWRGLAAVKAVNKLLFTVFGLGKRLAHEMGRAAKRLAKKAVAAGGTLTSWARNALVLGTGRKAPGGPGSAAGAASRPPRGMPPEDYQKARIDLLMALKTAHPHMTAEQCNAEADRIMKQKLRA